MDADINYYHKHLGDYAKDTGILTMEQHGAYNMLLDRYYGSDSGIPKEDVYAVAKAVTAANRKDVDKVLNKFFRLVRGVWIKDRCEKEIAEAQKRIAAAVKNGKKGGRPRNPEETHEEPSGLANGNPEGTQAKALQSPISIPQSKEKDSETKNGLAEARRELAAFASVGVKRIGR